MPDFSKNEGVFTNCTENRIGFAILRKTIAKGRES